MDIMNSEEWPINNDTSNNNYIVVVFFLTKDTKFFSV